MRGAHTSIGLFLASAAVGLLAPAAAQAQLNWASPQTLSVAEQNADNAHVAIDGQGNAVAAWRGFDGTNYRIQVALRPAGRNFGAPQFVSESGSDAARPEVAVNSRGDAIVVWDRKVPNGPPSLDRSEIRAAFQPAGESFGAPELASGGGEGAVGANVAIDAAGKATIVFTRGDAVDRFPRAQAADRAANGVWGNWHTVSYYGDDPPGPVFDPRIVVDPQGNGLATFQKYDASATANRVHATVRGAGQSLFPESPPLSGTAGTTFDPRGALGPNGSAMAVWTLLEGTSRLEAAYRPAGQSFSGPQTISEQGHAAFDPDLGFDTQGNAHVIWADTESGSSTSPGRIKAAFKPVNGPFGAPGYVSEAGLGAIVPRLATDAAGNAVAIWSANDGQDDFVQAALRPGAGGFDDARTISAKGDLAQPFDGGSPELAVNARGDAVAVWSRSDGENLRVEAVIGVPPDGVTPPPPPPPPPPPNPSAIRSARPFERGKAIVLTAQVSGQVDRLEWDFSGPNPPVVGRVVNGALQRSVRLRPPPGDLKVKVRAVGPGGADTFSRTFAIPRGLTGEKARAVDRGLDRADARSVFAVGDAATLTGRSDSCGAVTIFSGEQELDGCFRPVDALADIPDTALGILDPLARELDLPRTDAELMRKAVELTDAYVARGRLALDGTWPVVPAGHSPVVALLQAKALGGPDAALQIGGLKFGGGGGFLLRLDPRRSQIPLGAIPRPPSLPSIGRFQLVGDFDVDLGARESKITASLKLPSFVKKAGVDIQTRVKLRATPDQIIVDEIVIGPINVNVGALAVDRFQLVYARAANEWRGQGRACVVAGVCLDMVPPNGQIKIKNGRLDFAGASLGFPPPGIPLFSGVNLERVGFGVGLDPTRFTGNARLAFAHVLVIDGRLVIGFPTADRPFFLRRDEVGNDFPAQLYNYRYTGTTLGVSANAALRLPVIGEVPFANAYALYEYPGYIALGGGVNYAFREPITNVALISVDGRLAGEFNAGNGRFNIDGHVHACVVEIICKGVDGNVSSRGMAVCASVDAFIHDFHMGGAIRWSPFKFTPYLDGCAWGRYREPNVHGARVAQAGGPYVVRVQRGDPSRMVMLDGESGAPRVRVSGPAGQALESPAGSALAATHDTKIRILRSESAGFTAVGFAGVVRGTYKIETLPGSPAISRVREASALPPPQVSGKVSGRGARRVLIYHVRRRPDQRVTFVEADAGGGAKQIGEVTGGGRGELRFSPAPGRGTRRIEARFELDGVPAEQRVITRFKPPSPRLPEARGLSVRRKGKRLSVTWRKVRDATRYELALTMATGRQRFVTTRKREAVLRRVPNYTGGRVTVIALDKLRRSAPAAKRFKSTTRPKPGLRRLPRCRVKRRVICRRR